MARGNHGNLAMGPPLQLSQCPLSEKTTNSRPQVRVGGAKGKNTPRTGGSVGWASGCHAGGCDFDSDRTNTQGVKNVKTFKSSRIRTINCRPRLLHLQC